MKIRRPAPALCILSANSLKPWSGTYSSSYFLECSQPYWVLSLLNGTTQTYCLTCPKGHSASQLLSLNQHQHCGTSKAISPCFSALHVAASRPESVTCALSHLKRAILSGAIATSAHSHALSAETQNKQAFSFFFHDFSKIESNCQFLVKTWTKVQSKYLKALPNVQSFPNIVLK